MVSVFNNSLIGKNIASVLDYLLKKVFSLMFIPTTSENSIGIGIGSVNPLDFIDI